MSRYVITLNKSEIIDAVLRYVNSEVTIGNRRDLKDPTVTFRDKDGLVGLLDVDIEVKEDSSNDEPPVPPNY